MKIYMPTLVYSEEHCISHHRDEFSKLGKKAFIITGKHSSRKNGSLDDLEQALNSEQIEYVIFDEVEENPSIETVMKAREIGKKENVDFVIGVGGGSPMDASKAIALMIANPESDASILYQAGEFDCLPVVAIPTTAGTGSEVTPYSILTIHEQQTKRSISHSIFPKVALLDATYLKTASYDTLVNTAVDALAHLVESYLNSNSNELNRMYSERGLTIWRKAKEALFQHKLEDSVYSILMEASMLGGIAIAHTQTSLPHGLSYAITYQLGVPHGKAVGIFLAGYVATFKNKEEVETVLRLLGFKDTNEMHQYLATLLGEVQIDASLLDKDVKDLLSNQAKLKNYPFKITYEELRNML